MLKIRDCFDMAAAPLRLLDKARTRIVKGLEDPKSGFNQMLMGIDCIFEAVGGPLGLEKLNRKLIVAVYLEELWHARFLLALGADPNAPEHFGLVAHCDDVPQMLELVKRLPGQLAEIEASRGWPLRLAVAKGDTGMAGLLLGKGADPNIENGLPLFTAVRAHDTAMAALLLEKGADPNGRGGAMIWLAQSTGDEAMSRLLEERSARAAQTPSGLNPPAPDLTR